MPILFAKDYELASPPHTDCGYDFRHILAAIKDDIKVKASPGASLQDAMREALLLMCIKRKTITLTHEITEYGLLYPDVLTYMEAVSERK